MDTVIDPPLSDRLPWLRASSPYSNVAYVRPREVGGALERHLQRSSAMAAHLETTASRISRISTDGRTVVDVAKDVVRKPGGPQRQRNERRTLGQVSAP